jgi:cobalt-precorrin-6B (C15)-methyltransferase
MKIWPYDTTGIPDKLFSKGKSPITREEIRALVIAKLRLVKRHYLVDIGSGTGAVSIEAARLLTQGQVWAVEALSDRVDLISENCKKFGITNINVINGTAPQVLNQLPQIDRAFIGGSGNNLSVIIEQLIPKFNPEGRIVMTAVTLETLNLAVEIFSKPLFRDFEVLAVNLATLKNLQDRHLFQSEHTIHIIAANVGQER